MKPIRFSVCLFALVVLYQSAICQSTRAHSTGAHCDAEAKGCHDGKSPSCDGKPDLCEVPCRRDPSLEANASRPYIGRTAPPSRSHENCFQARDAVHQARRDVVSLVITLNKRIRLATRM